MAPLKREVLQGAVILGQHPLHDRKVMAPLKLSTVMIVSLWPALSMTARSWPH